MRTGEVEANLVCLNETFGLSYVDDLIRSKVEGSEKERIVGADIEFYEREYQRLLAMLAEAQTISSLPEASTARTRLNELLVSVRVASLSGDGS